MDKKIKRALILSTLVILFGFGGGFFIGQASNQTLDRLGLLPLPITAVFEDSELFSPELEALFTEQTGLRLRVLSASNYDDFKNFSTDADIWIARTCWLERISASYPTPSLVHSDWALKNISPDFITFNHRELPFAPLFWTTGSPADRTQTIALYLIGIKARNNDRGRKVVAALTEKRWIQTWTETISLATTYMTLDETLLDRDQKAAFLRELPFQRLELVTSTSDKCDISPLSENEINGF